MKRKLYIAWQSHEFRSWHTIGLLTHRSDQGYLFRYLPGALEAREKGFSGISLFSNFQKTYHSEQLFAFFSNRIVSSSRREYKELIEQVGLQPVGNKQSPAYIFDYLRRTRGWRATDAFEMFAPAEKIEGGYRWDFFTRGLSHVDEPTRAAWMSDSPDEAPQEPLQIAVVQNNPFDKNATLIFDQKQRSLGFVPRTYNWVIHELLEAADKVDVNILRQNLKSDLDQKRFLLEIVAQTPAGFDLPEPDDFKPLVED